MEIIRKNGLDKETIYTCYVIDDKKHLVGVLPLRTLLFADEDKRVEELMEEDVISISTLDDQEEAANLFRKYNFISLPVVDGENRLVGIITVDDIVDVIDEETTEEMCIRDSLQGESHSCPGCGIVPGSYRHFRLPFRCGKFHTYSGTGGRRLDERHRHPGILCLLQGGGYSLYFRPQLWGDQCAESYGKTGWRRPSDGFRCAASGLHR